MHINKPIDETIFKWHNNSQIPARVSECHTLNKIHKPNLAGRPIVSGKGGPTEHISSFIDSPLQPIAKNQESYIKDTTDFVHFIENAPVSDYAIIAILDVCSLYTDIKMKVSKLSVNSMTNIIGLVYQSPHPPPLGTLWSSHLKKTRSILTVNTSCRPPV